MKKIQLFIIKFYPFLFLVFLLCILFWQVFLKGYVFIDGDNFHLNIPLKYLLVDAVHNGYVPFWNPYIFAGIPYAADLNLATFNPLNILYFFFSVSRALTLQVILELFLVGCFQYLLLRLYKLEKGIALFGGIVLMLSGTIFAFTTNNTILHSIAYLPLLFFLFSKYFQTKKIIYFVLLIFSQGLQIISGHPQVTYYTIFFISLFFLFQASVRFKKRLLFLSTYLVVSVLLSAFQIIPFLELVMQSNRPLNSFMYASAGTFDVSHVLTIFFPTFFGTKLQGNWWGSQTMLFGYMGVVPLFFFVYGLVKAKFKNKTFFIVSLCMSFLLSLGKWGLLFYVFYYCIPGWSAFRSPADIYVLTIFFASIFSAFGLQYFLSKLKTIETLLKKLLFASLTVVIGIGLIITATVQLVSWIKVFDYLSLYNLPFVQKILFYSPTKIQSMFTGIAYNIFIFSLFFFTFCLFSLILKKRKKFLLVLLILLVSIDLLVTDVTYLQLAPESFYSTSLPNELRQLDFQFRIFSSPILNNHDKKYLPGPNFFYNEAKENLLELTDNHAGVSEIQSITGYSSLVLKRYSNYISDTPSVTGVNTSLLSNEKLNELGVKYALALNKMGQLNIEKNENVLPRVHLLNNTGNSVQIKKNTPNTIEIFAKTKVQNTLILADTYYPGWKAFVNGKEISIRTYKNVFRAITIPMGESSIIFIYDPLSWKLGLLVTFGGFVLLALVMKQHKFYE